MQSGDTLGKYQLVTRLGRGGMGEVWLAMALGYGGFAKPVVLKTLLPELENDPLYIEMLAHEARTCAKLNHPNLIEVFDFSKHGRTYLLAMEHVLGESLSQIMRTAHARKWPIPAWFALRVAWECCRGLDHAHEQGVIHCDLSPSNVMVTFTGVTKILDFGVAHSSADGDKADRLKGKWSYMAPERLRSLTTDRRTDVYALGVMLYLLFVGRLPFDAASDEELLRHKLLPPPRPSEYGALDDSIEQLIMRCLDPDPVARFQTAHEVLEALSPALDGSLGAYGQHDAAAFMRRLFDDRARSAMATTELPPLPPVPPRQDDRPLVAPGADADSRARTAPAAIHVEHAADFEIEIVSDVAIEVLRQPTVPAHGRALAKTEQAPRRLPTVVIPPLPRTQPPPPPSRPAPRAISGELAVPPEPPPAHRIPRASTAMQPLARPQLAALLGEGSNEPVANDPAHESRTTVQSLFGERRTAVSSTLNVFGGAGERPHAPEDEPSTSTSAWPWAVSRVKSL